MVIRYSRLRPQTITTSLLGKDPERLLSDVVTLTFETFPFSVELITWKSPQYYNNRMIDGNRFFSFQSGLLLKQRSHYWHPHPRHTKQQPRSGERDTEWRGGKGGSVFSSKQASSLLYTILKKNAFNHRLFMEKIPIKLSFLSCTQQATSQSQRQAGGISSSEAPILQPLSNSPTTD